MNRDNLGLPVFLLKGQSKVVLADGTVKMLFIPAGTLVLKAWVVVDRDMNDNTQSATLGDSATADGWRAAVGLDSPANTRAGTLEANTYVNGKLYTSGDWLTSAVVFTGDGVGEARFHAEALCVKIK